MTGAPFGCQQRKVGQVLVFDLLGYLDKDSGQAMAATIEKSLAGGERKIALNFERIEVINSQGMTTLLEIGSRITEDFRGSLAVFGLSRHLKLILEISSFFTFATVAAGEAEALRALG